MLSNHMGKVGFEPTSNVCQQIYSLPPSTTQPLSQQQKTIHMQKKDTDLIDKFHILHNSFGLHLSQFRFSISHSSNFIYQKLQEFSK